MLNELLDVAAAVHVELLLLVNVKKKNNAGRKILNSLN